MLAKGTLKVASTVGSVLGRVIDREGMSIDMQPKGSLRLMYAGGFMDSERTLYDHNVAPNATLRLVSRLCGGPTAPHSPDHAEDRDHSRPSLP